MQLAIGGGSRTFGFLGFIMSAIVPVFLSCIIPLYYYVTTYFTNDMHSGAKNWNWFNSFDELFIYLYNFLNSQWRQTDQSISATALVVFCPALKILYIELYVGLFYSPKFSAPPHWHWWSWDQFGAIVYTNTMCIYSNFEISICTFQLNV